jgi:hypothetical protein
MDISVEPRDGSELDRLVTTLLNVTGLVSCVIDRSHGAPLDDPEEVIGRAARWMRGSFCAVAEHYGDAELGVVVEILAECTLIAADDLGLGHVLRDAALEDDGRVE